MKRWTVMLVLVAAIQTLTAQTPLRDEVRLQWKYEPPSLTFTETNVEPSVEHFVIYAATELPAGTNLQAPARSSAWTEVSRISAVESYGLLQPGLYGIILKNQTAQKRFYVITALNYWGESSFSNVWGTPAPPARPSENRISR